MNFNMLQYIIGPTQTNRHRYRRIFEEATCPKVFLPTRRALNLFYRRQGMNPR
jgi:hypothetical protein